VHWHGIALSNDMDAVPRLTQQPVPIHGGMTYEFTVPDPGTYMFHPHVGTQLDRGLYGPLIVEDPHEPLRYDAEFTVVLDDWTDGVGPSPHAILLRLQQNGMSGMPGMGSPAPSMSGMDMSGGGGKDASSASAAPSGTGGAPMTRMRSALLGGDAGDVAYPLYLINGRRPAAPAGFRAPPGALVRLRILNPASATAFRVALGGHRRRPARRDGGTLRRPRPPR